MVGWGGAWIIILSGFIKAENKISPIVLSHLGVGSEAFPERHGGVSTCPGSPG